MFKSSSLFEHHVVKFFLCEVFHGQYSRVVVLVPLPAVVHVFVVFPPNVFVLAVQDECGVGETFRGSHFYFNVSAFVVDFFGGVFSLFFNGVPSVPPFQNVVYYF